MTALGWSGRSPRLRSRGRRFPVRPYVLPLESRIVPTLTFTVNSFIDGVDANPGDGTALTSAGKVSLRSAVQELNIAGGGTIILPAGSYTLSILGANEDQAARGDLDLLTPIHVQGAGSGLTTIHGDGSDRLFDIRTPLGSSFQGVTLTDGNSDIGGAVRAIDGGQIDFTDVVLKGNTASGEGGAIAILSAGGSGQVTLNNVLIQNNMAGGEGGGIFLDGQAMLINGATIAGNTATLGGGGLTVLDSQHTNGAAAQIKLTTFSGNSTPGQGGAVMIEGGIVSVADSTISLNQASVGGGIEIGTSVSLGNTIVAGNTAASGPDIFGQKSGQGFNLIGDGTGGSGYVSSDKVGTTASPVNPILTQLVVHGGTLPVQIPLQGSPAIGTGQSLNPTDVRGVTRPNVGADIGAVQTRGFSISATGGNQHVSGGTAFGPLTATVTEGGTPLPGASITFTAPTTGPSGTFAGSATVITNANGVATAPTYTANFQAGSYSVRAAASPTLFANIPLVNDVAIIDNLSVTAASPVLAGTPFQITVKALKPNGTLDTAYAGTVSFSTDAAAQATLPIPTTFGPTDAGQKTFMLLLNGLGSHTIHLTDPNGPVGQVTVNVQTDSFTVTATPPTQFGQPFQVTVKALKPDGTPDTAYTGTVSFAADATAAATLPAPTAFSLSDAGQKTFSVTLSALGAHTISVSDPLGAVGHVNVTVTPVTNRFHIYTDFSTVTEGQPFSISIQATDAQGNPLGSFVGPVTLTSDDPHAVLPTGIAFAPTDEGGKTVSGLVLFPVGPHTITATAPDGTVGSITLSVSDLGPSGLQLLTNSGSIHEGDTLTLMGTFTDPNPFGTHTVDVNWGDGAVDTIVHLAAGVMSFQTTHPYPNNPPLPNTSFPINVTVTEGSGVSTTDSTAVTIINSPPVLPPSPGVATGDAGGPFGQVIPFTDAGANPLTATADYGDGTGPHPVPISGHNLTLDHVFTTEGTYTVNVTLQDGFGGMSTLTEQAVVFLPGTTGIQVIGIPAGQSGTVSIPGAVVTLDNEGGTATAYLFAGNVSPVSLTGLNGSPTANPTQLVRAYDIRQLDAGPDSTITARLTYANGQSNSDPTVLYYDKSTGSFAPVNGSATVSNSFVVNHAGHTVTFILGGTSSPTVAATSGTVFTLSIPAPTPATNSTSPSSSSQSSVNSGTSPFFLVSAAPSSSALAALDSTSIAAPIATTEWSAAVH